MLVLHQGKINITHECWTCYGQNQATHKFAGPGHLVVRRWPARDDQLVVEPLVGPLFVIMRDELTDQVIQMRFTEHDKVVQAL
jgi:hypothetical protein